MNTVRSFWLGWGSLCVAGAGAYWYAKKEINADRQAKANAIRKRKEMVESLEYSENVPNRPLSSSTMGGTHDPPAPPHEGKPDDGTASKILEKSKYEASKPYVSPKGDRFS